MTHVPEVLCWGELLWDLFDSGPELGGAAANVAVHLNRLGHHARLVSRVGDDDLGHTAIARLAEEGVDVRDIQVDPLAPTGTVKVALTAEGPTFCIGQQAAWDRLSTPQLPGITPEALDAIVFGTLAQRCPMAQGALVELLASTSKDTLRVCDLNLRPPFVSRSVITTSLSHATVVKLNEVEEQHLGNLFGTLDSISLLLKEFDISLVALTLGDRGCRLVSRHATHDFPPSPLLATTGDSVGAGDAFTAVLTAELLCGTSPRSIGTRANAYAARVCSFRGAFGPRLPPPHEEAKQRSV